MIRAITFDLDDTLWEVAPVIERAEQQVQSWLERHYPRVAGRYSVESFRELRRQLADREPQRAHDLSYLRLESYRLAGEQADCGDGSMAERAFQVFIEHRHQVSFYQDVMPALEGLSGAYPLGVISNGNADVARLGIGHLFDFSLSAIQVGRPKPHPEIFQAACHRLGLPPREVVHVGDHPRDDILGASAAGLRTVWVNRHDRTWSGEQAPDAQISRLSQLPRVLRGW
jgi:putative hydrolase of the HAD superfamily